MKKFKQTLLTYLPLKSAMQRGLLSVFLISVGFYALGDEPSSSTLLSSMPSPNMISEHADAEILFHENNQLSVALSRVDSNRLWVRGDRIQALHGNAAYYSAVNEESGSIYLTINTESPFTVFVTTEQNRHFSLFIIPQATIGKTITLIPQTGSEQAKRWEQSSDYELIVVALIKAMMTGETPEGYGQVVLQKPKSLDVGKQATLTPVTLYRGEKLSGTDYRLTNLSKKPLTLAPSQFYRPGVRAIALSVQTLAPHDTGHVYIVEGSEEGIR